MVRIYGIPNCDTVKKARTWLELHNVAYEFVDFKKTPPREVELVRWKAAFGGWPVNRQGQTFRKHKAEFEALEESEVVNFLAAHASMIKRPVVEHDGKIVAFGFDEAGLEKLRAP